MNTLMNSAGKPMRLVYTPDVVTYRGEKFNCIHLTYHDDDSGEEFTTTESDTVWFNQVTNQYRERHGIPFTDEIVALREKYGVSAAKMSLILGFGANQYRLYEDGEVPSESNGKMIRGAMNPRVFLDLVRSTRNQLSERDYEKITANVERVISDSLDWKNDLWTASLLFRSGRGLQNGFAPQSTVRLKNLLLYVLDKMGEVFQTKMNKVLFYIDFLSYRERGMAISGLAYNAIDFGPVPQRWDRVYSAFDEVIPQPRMVFGQESIVLTTACKADMSSFTEKELELIDFVCAKMKNLSAHDISELSHNEPVWKNHLHQSETIPYSEAFGLLGV